MLCIEFILRRFTPLKNELFKTTTRIRIRTRNRTRIRLNIRFRIRIRFGIRSVIRIRFGIRSVIRILVRIIFRIRIFLSSQSRFYFHATKKKSKAGPGSRLLKMPL